ncbi:matrixin family metalloprotease [Kineosporia sp. A_224]|uniref:matrixin family metalloprotease n=1 Tax=Kineosporia sp. A_224 TaxID=1962180 RepID=UPI0013043878|nr:matrixin family metalloprotease [Kineosporia sp. A_224]
MITRSLSARPLLAAVLTLGLVFALSQATPARANYFGPSGCCAYADNGNHGFNQATMVAYNSTAMDYVRGVYANETNMTTFYDATEDPSTDVVAYDQYYTTYWGLDWDGSSTGRNILAWTKCIDHTLGGECDRSESRYDLADTDGMTTAQRRWIALHETGHSVGLDHSGIVDSMMQTNCVCSIIHINAHDKTHINSRWP